jgi:Arc/MetJ-type ribon-helix-helix transcriptional regulator
MTDDGRDVTLSAATASRIESQVAATEFDDVDSYVEYVLQEVLFELDDEPATDGRQSREQVQDRLEALGYLDG